MDTLLGKWLLSPKQYAALTVIGDLTLVTVCALRCVFDSSSFSHSCEKFTAESKGSKLLTV